MKNIFEKLNKFVVIAIYFLLIVTCINGCNGCSSQKENVKLRKEVDSLSTTVKSLKDQTYLKKDLDIRMEIEGYEISKRMLYDQNAIVRTTVRPDDRMNEYDKKIKELQEKILQNK
jgi:hypothetical protein